MISNNANTDDIEAWKKGILAGFRSAYPDRTPSIPAIPTEVPEYIEDTSQYYYKLGHETGLKMARDQ